MFILLHEGYSLPGSDVYVNVNHIVRYSAGFNIPTLLFLTNGVQLQVLESPNEVRERINEVL